MEIFGLSILALMTIILTLSFDFVNGFHDSANSIATIVATRVLSPVKAVAMAACFNFLGFTLGLEVAKRIGTGIIDTETVIEQGPILIFCAVAGAVVWDLITWWWGIPTSSSHALIGGLIGAGVAAVGTGIIVWSGTLRVVVFIAIAPLAGLAAALGLTILVMRLLRRMNRTTVNKYFRRLQLCSSAFLSLTHGSNDAQKAMGIIALVILVDAGMDVPQDLSVPFWVQIACLTAISLGTFFGGWRIVKTMASRITKLEPWQGFCAETGAALMLFSTAKFGIPVSTTHTISGAIMGVGATKNLSAVRWGVGRKIFIAWIVTIPASASIAGILFLVFQVIGV